MRIIIDYNGSKVICRITHYLNENNPHYNELTDIREVNDDVWRIVVYAFKKLSMLLKDDFRKQPWQVEKKGGKDEY